MELLLKAVAGTLVAIALGLVLSKYNKESALLISISMCCMIVIAAANYLTPAIAFFEKLEQIGQFDSEILRVLLKAAGIAILSEVAGLICTDAGNSALGKTLQLLAGAAILWLSLPLFDKLLTLIEKILISV